MLESFQQLSKTHSGPGFKTGGKATDIHGYFGLLPPKKNRYSVQDDLAISNQASGSAPPFCPLRTINIPFSSHAHANAHRDHPPIFFSWSSSACPEARGRAHKHDRRQYHHQREDLRQKSSLHSSALYIEGQ